MVDGSDPVGTTPSFDGALVDALFAAAPAGLALLDETLRFVRTNDRLHALDVGARPGGRLATVDDLRPELAGRVRSTAAQARIGGAPTAETIDGPIGWRVVCHPVAGGDAGTVLLVVDVAPGMPDPGATERLDVLARASGLLEIGLDVDERLHTMAPLAVPVFADVCAVYLWEPGGAELRMRALAALDATVESRLQPFVELRIGRDSAWHAAAAARTGEAVLVRDFDDFDLDQLHVDQSQRAALERLEPVSVLAVPLPGLGRSVGSVVFARTRASGRRYSDDDVDFAGQLATRMGHSVANALAFEYERSVAEELQRALLPAVLPAFDALDVAARYVPARGRVGGDWYDVLRLADGRIALVVGDVVGHGVQAATAMGALRYALLVFASETADPGRLLDRLNRFATRRGTDAGTVAIAVVDTDAEEVTVASAGHIPVLVRRGDGSVERHGVQLGVPLGVLVVTDFRIETIPFRVGDALVLVTDGVIERRGEAIDVGLARLDAIVAASSGAPEHLADSVLGPSHRRDDDAAVLVARRPVTTGFAFTAPAEAPQLPLVRQLFDRWLSARGVPAAVRAEMLLAVGEASANSVEHAYGPGAVGTFRVGAAIAGGELVVTVADDGRWRGRQPPGGGRGLELLHAIVDDVHIDRRDDGTTVTLRRFLAEGTG